jgi:hypothetical protein
MIGTRCITIAAHQAQENGRAEQFGLGVIRGLAA